MEREAWGAHPSGVTKSRKGLSDLAHVSLALTMSKAPSEENTDNPQGYHVIAT